MAKRRRSDLDAAALAMGRVSRFRARDAAPQTIGQRIAGAASSLIGRASQFVRSIFAARARGIRVAPQPRTRKLGGRDVLASWH